MIFCLLVFWAIGLFNFHTLPFSIIDFVLWCFKRDFYWLWKQQFLSPITKWEIGKNYNYWLWNHQCRKFTYTILLFSFTDFVPGCSGRNFGDDPRRQRRQLLRRASKPHRGHEEPGKLKQTFSNQTQIHKIKKQSFKVSLIKPKFTRKRNTFNYCSESECAFMG